jgi:hypothetical protein
MVDSQKFDCAGNVGGIQGHSQGTVFPIVEYQVGDNDYRSLAPFAGGCELSTNSGYADQRNNSFRLKRLEQLADYAAATLARTGGFTVKIGTIPTSGFMASVEGFESIVPVKDNYGLDRNDYAAIYAKLFDHIHHIENGGCIGGWVHEGQLYLDVSHHFDDESECRDYARLNNQLAYYDLNRHLTRYVGQ